MHSIIFQKFWTKMQNTNQSKIPLVSQWDNMFLLPQQALQQRLSNFLQTGLPLDKWNQVFWKLTKSRKHSSEQNTWWIPLKQRVLTSLAYCNKLWETFTNRTASRQVRLRISKTLTKIQKPLFRANCLVDPNEMKCSCFVGMYCNKVWVTSQTKLCLAIWNQVFTKTSPKSRKF